MIQSAKMDYRQTRRVLVVTLSAALIAEPAASAFSATLVAREQPHPESSTPAEQQPTSHVSISASGAVRSAFLTGKPQAVIGQQKSTNTPTTPKSTPAASPATPAPAVPTEQASAHDAVMRFLQGIKIAELPEGRQMLADTQWIIGAADRGENFYSRPDYTQVNSIFAALFDTDVPTVKGYKELFDMNAQTQAGTTANVKFLVISFKDATTGKWKVLSSLNNLSSASDIDIDRQVAYFKDHLTDTKYDSPRENYSVYGKWLLLDGRVAEARTAFTTAKTAPDTPNDPSGFHDNAIGDLQITTLLAVIDRITASPKTTQ